MKNTTLLFRSLAVIIIITGAAHLVSFASQDVEYSSELSPEEAPVSETYNEDTDYIVGNWRVAYNTDEFKGAIVYAIKKEGKVFKAYTAQYEDEQGNSEEAEAKKALVIKSFDGYKGKGIYYLEYENQTYDVKCEIDMVDENTFKLSYDYYGYADVETWKRQ